MISLHRALCAGVVFAPIESAEWNRAGAHDSIRYLYSENGKNNYKNTFLSLTLTAPGNTVRPTASCTDNAVKKILSECVQYWNITGSF